MEIRWIFVENVYIIHNKSGRDNPMGIFDPWADTYLQNCKLEEIGMIALKPINILMTTGEITKTSTLATTLYKPAGEANPYVWFGYVPLNIL